MKIAETSKEKKSKVKKNNVPKAKKEHVMIVAQEIKFARLLSGNEKKTRDRVLKNLKKWLFSCFEKKYEFKDDDFIRVWKGLFYAVWMSDKPLIQEELCDSIAAVLDQFPVEQVQYAILMTKAGFRVLATEWYGIDYHRMDKFLMLVRRYLRGSLRVLLRCQWSLHSCQLYAKMLMSSDGLLALNTPHYARNSLSMLLHFTDCYLEELAKVSNGDIPGSSVVELLRPFCRYMCGGSAPALCAAARRLLTALLRQSEPGLRYQHATRAWKQMGCPEGGPEALELVSDDDDEENGDDTSEDEGQGGARALDPRAGRVDVELASVPVPAAELAALLRRLLPTAASKAHKRVKICMQRFEQLARDEYPLRERASVPTPAPSHKPAHAAHALQKLEKKLVAASDELALRGLSRKHRKRLLAKRRAGHSIVDELGQLRVDRTGAATDDWQVESTEPVRKKSRRDTSDKENQHGRPKRGKPGADATNNRKGAVKGDRHTADERQRIPKADKTEKETKKKDKKRIENDKQEASKKNVEVLDKTTKVIEQGGVTRIKKYTGIDADSVKPADAKIKISDTDPKTGVTNVKIKVNLTDAINKGSATGAKRGHSALNEKRDGKLNKKKPGSDKEDETIRSELTLKVETKKSSDNASKNPVKPKLTVNKVKRFQKQSKSMEGVNKFESPKKVKFVLKNNSMQGPVDYFRSVRQSPSIPFDSSKRPSKTNLKPSMPSPINPFFKKKMKKSNRV